MSDLWQKLQQQTPGVKKIFVFVFLAFLAIPLFLLIVYNLKTKMTQENKRLDLQEFNLANFAEDLSTFDQLEGFFSSTSSATATFEK